MIYTNNLCARLSVILLLCVYTGSVVVVRPWTCSRAYTTFAYRGMAPVSLVGGKKNTFAGRHPSASITVYRRWAEKNKKTKRLQTITILFYTVNTPDTIEDGRFDRLSVRSMTIWCHRCPLFDDNGYIWIVWSDDENYTRAIRHRDV